MDPFLIKFYPQEVKSCIFETHDIPNWESTFQTANFLK